MRYEVTVKIFAAPLIAALALLVWICSGLLYCTAFIFGLAGTIVAILGVAVLVTYSVQNGIILLVIASSSLPWDCLWLRRGCWESSRPCAIPFRTGFTDKSNKNGPDAQEAPGAVLICTRQESPMV